MGGCRLGGRCLGPLADFCRRSSRRQRIVWLMLMGDTTESAIQNLPAPSRAGRCGGRLHANSNYKDTPSRRAALLKEKGLHYVDVGTSGGIWGLTEGYSLMIGGEAEGGGAAAACSSREASTLPTVAGVMSAPMAPVTSSRWSTTASVTG